MFNKYIKYDTNRRDILEVITSRLITNDCLKNKSIMEHYHISKSLWILNNLSLKL